MACAAPPLQLLPVPLFSHLLYHLCSSPAVVVTDTTHPAPPDSAPSRSELGHLISPILSTYSPNPQLLATSSMPPEHADIVIRQLEPCRQCGVEPRVHKYS